MEYLPAIFGAVAVYWAAMVSPGPNTVLITHTSMAGTRPQALAVAWGVATVSILWALAALAGLNVLFELFPPLATALRLAGGAYLIYLGIKSWRSASRPLPDRPTQVAAGGLVAFFRRGLLANLMNPKSVAFYGSILAAFLPPGSPLWAKLAVLAGIGASSFLWHSGLAVFFSSAAARRGYARAKKAIDRVSGGIMAALGVGLLAGR